MTEQVEMSSVQICHTKFQKASTTFKWIIHDFSLYSEEFAESKNSPDFSAPSHESKWFLKLFFFGCLTAKNKDYVSLFTNLKYKEDVYAYCNFYIINTLGEKTHCRSIIPRIFLTDSDCGYVTFISRETLLNPENNLLPNDTLTILYELTILKKSKDIVGSNTTLEITDVNRKLISGYESLFCSKSFADVSFVFDGKFLKAHKAIIGAHSPVFNAMFNTKMEETSKSEVRITDISYKVFNELLRFIYTGKISVIDDTISDLLMAADKYGIQVLKLKCEEILIKALTIDNAVDTLLIADMYNAESLKSETFSFITAHEDILFEDESISKIAKSPHLLKHLWMIRSGEIKENELDKHSQLNLSETDTEK